MKLIRRIDLKDQAHKIRFSHDGSRLWATSRGDRASHQIIEAHLYKTEVIRVKSDLYTFDMAFLNSEQVAMATITDYRQHKLVIYDIKKERIVSQVHTDDVRSLCGDYHRSRIFAGTLTGGFFEDCVGIYNSSGHPHSKFKVGSMPFDMSVSHLGDRLAIAGVYFEVWDVSSEPRRLSEPCPKDSDCTGTPCEANCVDITPDGRYAVAGFHGGKGLCAVIDIENGGSVSWLGPEGDEFHYYYARSVAISPDGKYVAVVSSNFHTVLVYRVADGTVSHKYPVFPCATVAFSPRGDMLAFGTTDSVALWSFEPA